MFKIFGITIKVNIPAKREHVAGDQRQVRVFAFFPTRIDTHTVVWLSYYYEDQVYRPGEGLEGVSRWYTQRQYLTKPAVT